MASIEDRWFRTVELSGGATEKQPTERHGKGLRWLVRWREPDGRSRKQSFAKRVQADAHAVTVEADKLRGSYIDARAGRELFGDYAKRWLATQTTNLSTRQDIGDRLRRYVEPYPLYRTQLGKVKPSTVQAWLRTLDGTDLAESTKAVVYAHVSGILNAAVEDELIAKNACRSSSVRAPRPDVRKVVPWSPQWVTRMHAELPTRYKVLVTLGAGLGLRQGELFGLAADDVDFLRGWVTVRRQVKMLAESVLVFAPPKSGKSREVPLPSSVRDEMAAYLSAFPTKAISLPWGTPDGKPVTVPLMVSNSWGRACNRTSFNIGTWKPAQSRAGIPDSRENGVHALRHRYASVLLDAGESVTAVSEYLGHSSAAITLKYYAHLLPASEARTRSAVDASWCAPSVPQAAKEGGLTSADNR